MALRDEMKERMMKARISPADLASAADITVATLYTYLRGEKVRDSTAFKIEQSFCQLEAERLAEARTAAS